jgi:uncharacterized protein (TIGR02145 family)
MNQAIADIIRGHIEAVTPDWIDKISGLVAAISIEQRGPDNTTVIKTFPVACCVSADDCKEGAYNELMPDSKYKSVIYFEDKGISFKEYKRGFKYYTSNLRLVGWLNIAKILGTDCGSEIPCTYAAIVIADIIRALPLHPSNISPFAMVFSEITAEEPRSNAIFSRYSYNEVHSQYLMAPYDYFALNIRTDFSVCLASESVYDATCDANHDYYEGFGALYNWRSIWYDKGGASIAPKGWHVPDRQEWETLTTLMGGAATCAATLKESGVIHWDPPNNGINTSGLTLFGGGYRDNNLDYFSRMVVGMYFSKLTFPYIPANPLLAVYNEILIVQVTNANANVGSNIDYSGLSIRLIKDDSTDPGSLTDIDGNIYQTVKIGNQVWMKTNLRVTHFNDGTDIALVPDLATWTTTEDPAYCWYNNIPE